MERDKFESAFSYFVESPEYDRAEESIFLLVRAAFSAGWHAAGGEPHPGPPPLETIKKRTLREI